MEETDFVMPYGKHKGSSLWDISLHDPTYLDWLQDNSKGNVRKAVVAASEHPDVKRRIDRAVFD